MTQPTSPREQSESQPFNRSAAYLESKGWKLVRRVKKKCGYWQAWEHPDHQHDRRGFFQKSEALGHQKQLDRGCGCDCIRSEGKP